MCWWCPRRIGSNSFRILNVTPRHQPGATAELEEKLRRSDSSIQLHSIEIKKLQELIERVRWITERMAVCCSPPPIGNGLESSTVRVRDVCQASEFNDLQDAVLGFIAARSINKDRELRIAERRLAAYERLWALMRSASPFDGPLSEARRWQLEKKGRRNATC
jgi:hypothetical protein